MSDMIDGLSRMALEAGQEASRNLTSAPVLAIMAERVHAGRRRRRVRATVTAGGFVAAAFAAAIVVSQLGVDPPEVEPAQTGTAIVSSVGNLTVFSDGSMSLYTQRGTFVDFPPATGPENAFAAVSGTEACSFDPGSVQIGWTFHVDEGRQVILFGRPGIVLGPTERRTTTQGEHLGTFGHASVPHPTFTMDAEVATAPQLAIRETVYDIVTDEGVDGVPPVKSYASQLDVSPEVVIAGDVDSFNRVATIQARPVGSPVACMPGFAESILMRGEPYSVRRYLVADVFLVDRAGHSMLLATHVSWHDLEITP